MFFWCVKNKQIMLGRHAPLLHLPLFSCGVDLLVTVSLALSLFLSFFLPFFCIKNYVVYAHFIVFVLHEIAPGQLFRKGTTLIFNEGR